jgi:hypothetical protein
MNPQAAARQIPSPKPSHSIAQTRPDVTPGSTISDSDDVMVNQKINGICRGC